MADPQIPDPESVPGISITRVFEAPRELVWREWTTPDAFADWFGAPTGEIPLDSVEMDVREGGTWKATMRPPACPRSRGGGSTWRSPSPSASS